MAHKTLHRNERRTRFVYPGDQLIAPSLNYMCQRTDFSLRLNFQLELEIIIIELFQFFIRSLDSLKAPRVGKSVKINCRWLTMADKAKVLRVGRRSKNNDKLVSQALRWWMRKQRRHYVIMLGMIPLHTCLTLNVSSECSLKIVTKIVSEAAFTFKSFSETTDNIQTTTLEHSAPEPSLTCCCWCETFNHRWPWVKNAPTWCNW